MADLIGQQLGQYKIVGLLGEGGMATVYRARQESMGRYVAIKVIESKLARNPAFVKRFEREAKTIASLSNTHILKVFDYGRQDDAIYLVMELLPSGSLADLIGKGPLPLARANRLLDQIASALDYAHHLGIVQRDLKPQNVLLDPQGNAILTDFGIAKILSETTVLTQSGVTMGTPAYMSPEQWQGGTIDARSDVYSLGVMLFEMLSGQLPFNAATPVSMMYLHMQQEAPSIRDLQPEVPGSVAAVLKKALAKAPDQRFQTAGQLAAAFRAALSGRSQAGIDDSVMASASASALQPGLPVRRLRTSWLAAGVIAVIVVVGLSWLAAPKPGPALESTLSSSSRSVAAASTPGGASDTDKLNMPTAFPVGVAAAAPTKAPPKVTEAGQLETLAAATIASRATLTAIIAASFTKTPTPNAQETLNAIVALTESAQAVTATANAIASHTKTPTLTATPTPTSTVPPTSTPKPSPTLTATPALISMANPPASLVISPDNASQVTEWAVLPMKSYPGEVAFSPDGKTLAINAYQVRFYDLQTLKDGREIESGDGFYHGIVFSPDWRLVATMGNRVQLWDPTSGAEVQSVTPLGEFDAVFNEPPAMAFSPDARLLAVRIATTVKIVDVQSGSVLKTLSADTPMFLTNVAFSPDGKLLVAGSLSGIFMWDTTTWQSRKLGSDSLSGARHLVFSPDGKKLAALRSSGDEKIVVWDIASGRQLATWKTEENRSSFYGFLAFSPDGRLLASGHTVSVKLWDVTDGRLVATLLGHTSDIKGIAFAPNGTALATSSMDQSVRLWGLPARLPPQ